MLFVNLCINLLCPADLEVCLVLFQRPWVLLEIAAFQDAVTS